MSALVRMLSRALPKEAAGRLAAVLSEAGVPEAAAVSVFEVDEAADLWQVEALYEAPPDIEALAVVLKPAGFAPSVLRAVALPELDWVRESQRRLSPVRAGRFFLHGRHDRGKVPAGSMPLELEAGQAFGTGHHGTTQGCLLALQKMQRAGFSPRQALDVGTGSGVLAMAAVRLWRIPVLATDIDATALKVAAENLRMNQTRPLVRTVVANGVRHALVRQQRLPQPPWRAGGRRRSGHERPKRARLAGHTGPAAQEAEAVLRRFMPLGYIRLATGFGSGRRRVTEKRGAACRGYDLVMANILAGPLRAMARTINACVADGGWLVLSGLLIEQEAMVLTRYTALGFERAFRIRCDGWSTLVLRKGR